MSGCIGPRYLKQFDRIDVNRPANLASRRDRSRERGAAPAARDAVLPDRCFAAEAGRDSDRPFAPLAHRPGQDPQWFCGAAGKLLPAQPPESDAHPIAVRRRAQQGEAGKRRPAREFAFR